MRFLNMFNNNINNMKIMILMVFSTAIFWSCHKSDPSMKPFLPAGIRDEVISDLKSRYPEASHLRISRGVEQVAAMWFTNDGSPEDFKQFCFNNFVADEKELDAVFNSISRNFEIINGHFHKMDVELKEPVHMDMGPVNSIDMMFGSYNASAHLTNDLFENKIAFFLLLNFPSYSLQEKSEKGIHWSRKEWAYARVGDIFTSRIPSSLIQQYSEASAKADNYIAEYNIYMDKLVDQSGISNFRPGLKLITHWGLRDELKSNYADKENGLKKQKMIYQVMLHIIHQTIPEQVINKNNFQWNPETNELFSDARKVKPSFEPDTRYHHLLTLFRYLKAMDEYCPRYPTYMQRAFDENMEISQAEVEALFTQFISSAEVKQVASLIEKRLGRPLEPFDIWYNGFQVTDQSLDEEKLNQILRKKYPDKIAFEKDLPRIMSKMGFSSTEANRITSLIQVDPSRGAGHAWGAEMRSDKSRLRTRIGADGMDYKGYNIAVHEFGHNVEQTITLYDMDYYFLHGVPNTAFTEAIAFLFQKRDRWFLEMQTKNDDDELFLALDNFWSNYEIMGVSMVDMKVWKWLYANPECNAAQLKDAVNRIACEVWNAFYAPVFGMKDQPVLAIYSHMIDNPLYLPAYPIGHIIDFQVEQAVKDKNVAAEITRMLRQGRIIPQLWMKGAVNQKISVEPILEATRNALKRFENK